MASFKKTFVTALVLCALGGLGIAGGFSWLWWQQRALQNDLDRAEQLLADGQPLEADRLLAPRLMQADASTAWAPRAIALRLAALEAVGDRPAQQTLARQVLDPDDPWVAPGQEAWARAQLVLGDAALTAKHPDEARQRYEAVLAEDAGAYGADAAAFGLARVELAAGETLQDGQQRLAALAARLPEGDPLRPQVEQLLGDVNIRLLMSRQPYGNDQIHTIARGETLDALAQQFNVSPDLLMRINGIANPRALTVGRRIKVPDLDLSIKVNKTDNTLTVTNRDAFFKRYRVRTGAYDYMTPTGDYTIGRKVEEPAWTDPRTRQRYAPGDPGNQLGVVWMGFASNPSIGIHEAVDPTTVGTYGSNGCVGLARGDVLELYDLVRVGTPVHIVGIKQETSGASDTFALPGDPTTTP